jgi:hypothetical protein
MAITQGAYGTANAVTAATAGNFIPEIWSDEIVAAWKRELVATGIIRTMDFTGRKGDTIHVPSPTRGQANAKLANTDVTIQQDTESEVTIVIDKHFEYSRLIEDIVGVQAKESLRTFYTDDGGYALARQLDTDVIRLGRTANNGAGTAAYATAFIAGDGNTLYTGANQTAITSAGIRRLVQRLDDSDVPMSGRYLLLPPVGRNVMMGIAEYTANSFTGEEGRGNVIRNGQIGDVYGIPVLVTPNADTATGGARIGLIGHRDSLVAVIQRQPRSQTQYKQEKLATLLTVDTLYGVRNLRTGSDADVPAGVYSFAMPA